MSLFNPRVGDFVRIQGVSGRWRINAISSYNGRDTYTCTGQGRPLMAYLSQMAPWIGPDPARVPLDVQVRNAYASDPAVQKRDAIFAQMFGLHKGKAPEPAQPEDPYIGHWFRFSGAGSPYFVLRLLRPGDILVGGRKVGAVFPLSDDKRYALVRDGGPMGGPFYQDTETSLSLAERVR